MVLNTFEEKLMSSTYLMLIERFSVLEIHPNAKKRCFLKASWSCSQNSLLVLWGICISCICEKTRLKICP